LKRSNLTIRAAISLLVLLPASGCSNRAVVAGALPTTDRVSSAAWVHYL
jgi:hypothetical protein